MCTIRTLPREGKEEGGRDGEEEEERGAEKNRRLDVVTLLRGSQSLGALGI